MATVRETERGAPPLQVVPRLELSRRRSGLEHRGGGLVHRGLGPLRTPVAYALAGTAVAIVAAAAFVLAGRSHRTAVTRPMLAAATVGGAASAPPTAEARVATAQPPAGAGPAPAVRVLSFGDLVSLADGASSYQPAPYLVSAYRAAAAEYRIPWRLLAAVEYIKNGSGQALAGASAGAEQALAAQVSTSGSVAVDARTLAQAASAAAAPSAALLDEAQALAHAGAANSPGAAAATVMSGTGVSSQAVLTLAAATDMKVSSSSSPQARIAAMLGEARLLNGLPYIWGGGHTNPPWVASAGYDCSGFVSEVLHAGGYLTSPETTQTLPGAAGIANGPGKYVTIYDRTIATLKVWVKKKKIVRLRRAVNTAARGVHVTNGRHATAPGSISIMLPRWVGQWETLKLTRLVPSQDTTNNDEHVIIDIHGQWWESGGSSADGGANMVHRMAAPSPSYLKSFNRILHPQGL